MSEEPIEPLTQLQEGAAALHELYLAYLRAGFTVDQAMALVGAILVANVRNAGGG